jgi:hypothetical protein
MQHDFWHESVFTRFCCSQCGDVQINHSFSHVKSRFVALRCGVKTLLNYSLTHSLTHSLSLSLSLLACLPGCSNLVGHCLARSYSFYARSPGTNPKGRGVLPRVRCCPSSGPRGNIRITASSTRIACPTYQTLRS